MLRIYAKRVRAIGAAVRFVVLMFSMVAVINVHGGDVEPCEPMWVSTFGGIRSVPTPKSMLVWDDGTGPAIYGCSLTSVWRWDGTEMQLLGSDNQAAFEVIGVFDDGSGPALYVGGEFIVIDGVKVKNIAKWEGMAWSPVGNGVEGGAVRAMCVFDDGSGPALYIGGGFHLVDGFESNRVVRWNGATWESVGMGLEREVYALAVFDDGLSDGPSLYAGGTFGNITAKQTRGIARWDGVQWTNVDLGVWGCVGGGDNCTPAVFALTVYDDGSGPALYAGGRFTTAGLTEVNNVARWDGKNWWALDNGLIANSAAVYALHGHIEDGKSRLYVGGNFDGVLMEGAFPANNLAYWDGESWWSVGNGVKHDVYALATFNDDTGGGPELHIGGSLISIEAVDEAGDLVVKGMAKLSGGLLQPIGTGMNNDINALEVFDDGAGPALFAAGNFTSIDGAVVNRIAKWNGAAWEALGTGTDLHVFALEVFDDGGGPALYAGGTFQHAGGVEANGIARWDGRSWSAVGGGVSIPGDVGSVLALKAFVDADGPALYVGGTFTFVGDNTANHIARWDGENWSALGDGSLESVRAIEVFDDGSGSAVVAGGQYEIDGAEHAFARWNGESWESLGQINNVQEGAIVTAFAVQTGVWGGNAELYVAGFRDESSSNTVHKLAGGTWSLVGGGIYVIASTMSVYNDGNGIALYAGGSHLSGGANYLWRWNGFTWTVVNSSIDHQINKSIRDLVAFDDGSGPALFAAGSFVRGPEFDSFIAKYQGCPIQEPILGDANGDGMVNAADLNLMCAIIGASQGDLIYLSSADFNGDGTIDHLDLAILEASYPRCAGDTVSSISFAPPPDGVTDAADLAFLLGAWGGEPNCADFVTSLTFAPPPDGVVDAADLAYLLGAWGPCE